MLHLHNYHLLPDCKAQIRENLMEGWKEDVSYVFLDMTGNLLMSFCNYHRLL